MTDSTILIKSPDSWKFKAAVGIGGLAVVVILAFLYRIEVGLIVLAIGSAIGARVWVWAIHQYKLAEFERRRVEAEVAKAEAEAIQAKTRAYFVEVNAGTFVLDGIAIASFYPAVTASRLLADATVLLPPPEPRLRRLLDVKFEHMLIVGPSGSGKTTALCHLIENAPPNALVYVLDPHAQFSQWPERVNEVVGIGRDYEAINTRLVELITIMDRRYNGLEPVTQKVLIVADEWLIIRDKCSNAERFFTEVGSEARKVNLSLIISSISSILDDLAVSGAIRDNFAQLALNRTLKDKNQGELKWSRRDTELVELPGRYRAVYTPAPPLPRSPAAFAPLPGPVDNLWYTPPVETDLFDPGPTPPTPAADELRICELWDGGASLRAIWKEVYGTEFGGKQSDKLKGVLVKWGRVTE